MSKMRIDKYISSMGIDTRKQIKIAAKRKQVLVNGQVVTSVNDKITPEEDKVTYKGKAVVYEAFVYLMLNKPKGVISATEDNYHKTVMDLLPEKYSQREAFPVGRLDIDTVGLLLITDDGKLAHNVVSPKKHVDKVYLAKLDQGLSEEELDRAKVAFEKGLLIDKGYECMPAKIERAQEDEVLITITEGKFHQVKRMVRAIGREVVALKRLSYGGLYLDEALNEGEYKVLTYEEVKKIMAKA